MVLKFVLYVYCIYVGELFEFGGYVDVEIVEIVVGVDCCFVGC